jgi:hypothetical protein
LVGNCDYKATSVAIAIASSKGSPINNNVGFIEKKKKRVLCKQIHDRKFNVKRKAEL